jgi:hypothetical protein
MELIVRTVQVSSGRGDIVGELDMRFRAREVCHESVIMIMLRFVASSG